tara:strand:- start:1709 stop:2899 length:1191 start_codon:yes stop_codon:yes gene_type:complete
LNADLRTVSICTGIGGLELGIKSVAKTRTVMYVENEITAVQVLVKRMEEGLLDPAPIWSDLRTFRGEGLHGKVDILIGGFPCQPFSAAGKRLGADDPRNLWPDVRRIAEELGHPALFLENVSNITEYYYNTIRPELQEMGYRTTEGLFSAREVGLPHRRQRLLMLACVTDTDYLEPYLLSNANDTGDSTQRHESDEYWTETDKRQTRFTFAESTGQSEVVEDSLGIGQSGWERGLQEEGDGGEEPKDKTESTSNIQSHEERVADTNSIGYVHCKFDLKSDESRITALSDPTESSEALADCMCEGLQGCIHLTSETHATGCSYTLRFAPPTLDDELGWAYTLAHMPEVEPSFCRVVNGLPVGMEQRLRMLGNGVVPSMAARGFTELVKKLQDSKSPF